MPIYTYTRYSRYLVLGGARCAGSSSSQSRAQVSMPRLQQQHSSRVAGDTGRYRDNLQSLSFIFDTLNIDEL